MTEFLSEAIGTFVLILFGCGLNAGLSLNKSFSNKNGNSWSVGTLGWGLAVTLGVYAGKYSGAHINPAVTIGLLSSGEIELFKALEYIAGQCLGAFVACFLVYIHYLPHWSKTEDKKVKLGVFATSPSILSKWSNLNSELIGAFILLFGLKFIGINDFAQGLNPIIVGALVCAIGISLGGTTGYAINPVRDFIPRVSHFILPIKGKGDSNFKYSWVPIIGPIVGGILGVNIYEYLFENTVSLYLYISLLIFFVVTALSIIENKN
jgi:glycerol uptake facilitator protein